MKSCQGFRKVWQVLQG